MYLFLKLILDLISFFIISCVSDRCGMEVIIYGCYGGNSNNIGVKHKDNLLYNFLKQRISAF